MADYLGSQNIKTKDAGDVDVFVSDATTPSQKLKVNADGSIDTNTTLPAGTKVEITDGTDDLAINADGSINAVVTATDLDIRDLSAAQDNVAISDGTDVLAVNADGSINSVVTATDLDIRDLAFATDKVDVSNSTNVGVVATDLDIRDLSAAQDNVAISDGTDQLEINADGSINSVVTATDLDIRDLNAATDSVQANLFDEAGVAYSASNPLPVAVASDQEGDEICDYNTTAAVAASATTNHDYTVTAGKTFIGEEAYISAGGYFKADLLINGSTVFTGFGSPANPQVRFPLEKICKANAAEVIRITIENCDDDPQDVYSTLLGLVV